MAELFVPSGSTAELPVAPEPYENVEPILEGAISEWDDAMQSKYGGLLIARPPFYVQGDYPIQGRSDWRWDPETYRYMHEDEDDIDADESRVLSELLSELMIEKGLAFLDRMLDRSIPIIEWVFEEYERLQRISLTQYLLGVGGALVLTGSMFGGLKDFLRKQFGFFENFARQIKDGLLSVKEIIRRAKMYWEAVKGRYSAGRRAGTWNTITGDARRWEY